MMKVRLYLVDEHLPVLLDDFDVKLSGFVTGVVENHVYMAIPQWRVLRIETVDGSSFPDEVFGPKHAVIKVPGAECKYGRDHDMNDMTHGGAVYSGDPVDERTP